MNLEEERIQEGVVYIKEEVRERIPAEVRQRLHKVSSVRHGKILPCEARDLEIVVEFIEENLALYKNLYPELRSSVKGLICYFSCKYPLD
jgi:hypothetical protein